MRRYRRKAFGLLGSLLILPLCAPAVFAAQPVNKRASIDADASIEVSNTSGSIEVRGWDRNEIEVTGSIASNATLEFNADARSAIVKVISPHMSWGGAESATLHIRAPVRSRLVVAGVSADITVEGMQGSQQVQSVSGNIKTQAWKDDVGIKTVSGDVTISGHQANAVFDFNTVSGDLQASGIGGEVNFNTVSGDGRLQLGGLTRSRLHSTSGDLEIQGELLQGARVDAESTSGEITLKLGGAHNAQYEFATFSGDISNCFGPAPAPRSKYGPGKELHFTAGNGAARIRAQTLSGDVHLCDK